MEKQVKLAQIYFISQLKFHIINDGIYSASFSSVEDEIAENITSIINSIGGEIDFHSKTISFKENPKAKIVNILKTHSYSESLTDYKW